MLTFALILLAIIVVAGIFSSGDDKPKSPPRGKSKPLFSVKATSKPYKRLLRRMHGKN